MADAPTSVETAAIPDHRARMRSWWHSYGWWVVGGFAIVAFLFGLAGFEERSDLLGEAHSLQDSVYRSVQLFVLESGGVAGEVPWTLEVARLLAPLVFAYTATRALMALFRDQIQLLGLRFLPGHIIVCGLGDKGMSLVRSLSETSRRIVVVERDAENDMIESARGTGALVLIGDAQDSSLLKRAGVATAGHLAAVCGADSTNAEIAVKAMRLVAGRGGDPLVGVVHIVDLELCALLRTEELAMALRGPLTLEFFNIFEQGARALLDQDATSPFRNAGPGGPHLVVVGLSRFGTSIIVQAAGRWAGLREEDTVDLRITLVGRDAEQKRIRLESRYPLLGNRLESWEMDIESGDFYQARFLDDDPSAIYICVNDDTLAVSAALTLQRALQGREIPVVVRLTHATGLGSLLGRGSAIGGDFEILHPFGLLDETCRVETMDGVYERMARELHAAYLGRPLEEGEWATLADRDRASNRGQAAHTGAKLRAVECGLVPLADEQSEPFLFTPAEFELLAMLEHDRWCAWTRNRGYRYGEQRLDRSELTRKYLPWLKGRHPQLRPWSGLPDDVKEIDRKFIRHLPEVLAAVDQRIVRLDEKLPRAIHAAYLRDREQTGETPETNPSLRTWDELPETLKNANRDQAAHLRIKLRDVGYELAPATVGVGSQPFAFTPTEFEQLAELEHERWVAQRLTDGWQVGPTKDLDRKLSPPPGSLGQTRREHQGSRSGCDPPPAGDCWAGWLRDRAGSARGVAMTKPSVAGEVYISYASEDVWVARELRVQVETGGHSCWMAPDDVEGPHWWPEIVDAIQDCRVVLVIVSSFSNESPHVWRELQFASEEAKPLLPIRTADIEPKGTMPYLLALALWIDVFPGSVADYASRVVDDLLGTCGTDELSLVVTCPKRDAKVGFSAITALEEASMRCWYAPREGRKTPSVATCSSFARRTWSGSSRWLAWAKRWNRVGSRTWPEHWNPRSNDESKARLAYRDQ